MAQYNQQNMILAQPSDTAITVAHFPQVAFDKG